MPLKGLKKVKESFDDIYTRQNENLRGVYLAGLAVIVSGTPADTGRARNNWFLAVGAPSSKTTTSKSKGLSTIKSLRKMPQRVLNRKIFYSNNLPYANMLEYGGFTNKPETDKTIGGFSKQAPGGFVRKALILMQNKIRSL